MQTVLTQAMVEKINLPKKAADFRDTRLKGLVLRVTPSGGKSFYCEYGRGKRIWLGRADAIGVAEARESARAILAQVFTGINPKDARKPKPIVPTLRVFLDGDYAIWAKAHQKAHIQNLKRLKTAFERLLDKRLDEFKGFDLERWRAGEIERGLSLETINRDISSIKAALNRAVDWELIEKNPFAKVKKSRTDDCPKVRFLSTEEEIRLRAALEDREERRRCERDSANRWRSERGYVLLSSLRQLAFTDHLKPLVLLSINTGCRRGELFDLTWSNVDLARRMITVTGATAKSKRTRHIPLNREAMIVLEGWRAQAETRDGLVFLNDAGERFDRVNFSWRRLLRDACISAFRWHDMRHHFASQLVMGGVDLNTVRELLGHSDYAMTLRYAHLAPEYKLRAVEVLDRTEPLEEAT